MEINNFISSVRFKTNEADNRVLTLVTLGLLESSDAELFLKKNQPFGYLEGLLGQGIVQVEGRVKVTVTIELYMRLNKQYDRKTYLEVEV
jgi:hypothetical protein